MVAGHASFGFQVYIATVEKWKVGREMRYYSNVFNDKKPLKYGRIAKLIPNLNNNVNQGAVDRLTFPIHNFQSISKKFMRFLIKWLQGEPNITLCITIFDMCECNCIFLNMCEYAC